MSVQVRPNSPMNFCEKCNKIVPDSEVRDLKNLFGLGKKKHIYMQTVNAYKNQRPGTIGCDLVSEIVWCGDVREPNEQEYFIYHTLKV